MPPFVHQGPDIPLEVLEAHQEERLLLFCGAGVSKNLARLPLFKDLVAKVYAKLGEVKEDGEKRAFKSYEFDRVLDLLEKRQGNPQRVRQAVADVLDSFKPTRRQLKLHKDLLDISRTRRGYRLVTTNFDKLFESAAGRASTLRVDAAPALPLPKRHTWASLVHLHGRVDSIESMVLTSGDFGNAYIVEGWASRFVSELFRDFTVLFVGYSANDVILRYLLDAIAAERSRGSEHREPFALTDIPQGETEESIRQQWKEKGVVAIPYVNHRLLPATIEVWAKDIASGLQSKISLALRDAERPPQHPDHFVVRRTAWLLSLPGVAAAWARRQPPVPIGWLPVLARSNVPGLGWLDREPGDAGLMQPRYSAGRPPALSQNSLHLGTWLCQHLASMELIDWVLQRGGLLHPDFRELVREELKRSANGQSNSSLTPPQRRIWELLSNETYAARLAKRLHYVAFDPETAVPGELLDAFRAIPLLSSRSQEDKELWEQWPHLEQPAVPQEGPRLLQDLVRAEVVLVGDWRVDEVAAALRAKPDLFASSAHALTSALEEVLQWQRFLEEPEEDPAWLSIGSPEWNQPHRPFDEWLLLGGLVRDSYFVLEPRAREALVARWAAQQSSLFDRLVLFVLSEDEGSNALPGIEILLSAGRSILWSYRAKEEVYRFLQKSVPRASCFLLKPILRAVLSGPQEELFQEQDADAIKWRHRVIGERLARFRAGGMALPAKALKLLSRAERKYGWTIDDLLQEGPLEMQPPSIVGALQRQEDFLHLMDSPPPALLARLRSEDVPPGWRQFVEKRPVRSLHVLRRLAKDGIWPPTLWRTTLNAFPAVNEKKRRARFWKLISWLLQNVPGHLLQKEASEFTHWLLASIRRLPVEREGNFWFCWDRHWSAVCEREEEPEYAGEAPVQISFSRARQLPEGDLILALLDRMWVRRLDRGQQLPEELRSRLSRAMSQPGLGAQVAHLILANHLLDLHYLDPVWTRTHLLPLFDWQHCPQGCSQAVDVWAAYLHNARIDIELLVYLKPLLFQALEHREELGKQGQVKRNLLRLVTFSGIGLSQEFKAGDSRRALRGLSTQELRDVISAVETLFRDAGDGEAREKFWLRRIRLWIQAAWPKDRIKQSPAVTESWVEALMQMKAAYPLAVTTLAEELSLLAPVDSSVDLSHLLDAGCTLFRRYAAETLLLLNAITPLEPQDLARPTARAIRAVLSEMVNERADLREAPGFKRIDELLLSLGIAEQ